MWSSRSAAAAFVAVVLSACDGSVGPRVPDGGRLAIADACELFVSNGEACGTYRPGSLGGTDRTSDIAQCTSSFGALDDRCEALFSDLVLCGSGGCGEEVAHCSPLLDELSTTCAP